MSKLTWTMVNQLRQRGLLLDPNLEYEDEELAATIKKQYESYVAHCETDNLIIQKAAEQQNSQNPG